MPALPRCATVLAVALLGASSLRGFPAQGGERADLPWKIQQTVPAIYPVSLIRAGITHGEARVRLSIDAQGELLDALVIACSHRDFGEEALRTVRRWRYEAAQVGDGRVGVIGDVTFVFMVNGPVAVEKVSPEQTMGNDAVGSLAYHAVALKFLDRIPTPTQIVNPVYPKEWSDRGIEGRVTVEFYIDETGRARIPFVRAADHGLLGASAAAAVAQWRFEPATRQGRPVLVRAEQVFSFFPDKK